MASAPPTSEFSSLFAKKKGKKGKRTVKGLNLNVDSGKPKTEEKPKIAQMQEILGGPDPADDDGWADVVEKKSVVATGGKQVSDLIDMTTLMTEDETTARKLEKKDIKQAFHDARTVKEPEKEPEPEAKEEEKVEAPKPRSLSSNIFGGGAARPGGMAGGWQARMQERELKQREQALSVDNTFAFPSLADAMSGPAKPKPGSGVAPDASGRRRVGGSSASAAIRAALGRPLEDEAPKASEPSAAATATDTAASAEAEAAEGGGADAPPPPAGEGAAVATVSPPLAVVEETEGEESKAKASEPVWVAASAGGGWEEEGGAGAGEAAVVGEGEGAGGGVEADKQALVQQFGKKKKKKKKPAEGEQAVGEP